MTKRTTNLLVCVEGLRRFRGCFKRQTQSSLAPQHWPRRAVQPQSDHWASSRHPNNDAQQSLDQHLQRHPENSGYREPISRASAAPRSRLVFLSFFSRCNAGSSSGLLNRCSANAQQCRLDDARPSTRPVLLTVCPPSSSLSACATYVLRILASCCGTNAGC